MFKDVPNMTLAEAEHMLASMLLRQPNGMIVALGGKLALTQVRALRRIKREGAGGR
jgi:hypothetical protein